VTVLSPQALHELLKQSHRGYIIPPRPEKNTVEGQRASEEFVEGRRGAVQLYLNQLAAHPVIGKSEVFPSPLPSLLIPLPLFLVLITDAWGVGLPPGSEPVFFTDSDPDGGLPFHKSAPFHKPAPYKVNNLPQKKEKSKKIFKICQHKVKICICHYTSASAS